MFIFIFFNDTAPTEIYTLSLHDALPISDLPLDDRGRVRCTADLRVHGLPGVFSAGDCAAVPDLSRTSEDPHATTSPSAQHARSEEHTSELQSRQYLVCRLLLEKKIIVIS